MIDPKRVEEARAVIRAQMTQQSPQPGSQSNQGSQGDIGAQVRQKIQSAGLGAPKQTTSYTPTGQGGFQSMPGNRIAGISEVTEPARNVVKGFGKSLAKIGQTILKPIDSGLAKLGIKGATTSGGDLSDENLKRKGFWQGVGGFTGDALYGSAVLGAASPLATTITKSSLALKAPGVVQKLVGQKLADVGGRVVQKLADVGGRSVLDASLGYGTTKLMGGNNENAKTAAVISGAIPWASAAFSGVGKLVGGQKLGEKIQTALIKPGKKDVANGFDIKNINKYGLGGNLEQTAEKTQAAILERVTKLKSQLERGSATVDLNKTLSTLAKELDKVKLENAGSNLALKRELEKFVQEAKLLSKDGVIDIADAQRIKQAFGAKGAWEFNVPREDANAIEEVYTKAYRILKNQIEVSATSVGNTAVRQINKELSDLIPIEQALIRRLPVAARQNPISLTDLVAAIGGSKLGLPLYILSKASKSGNIGSALAGIGSRPQSRGALGTLISCPGIKQLENAPKIGELNIPKVNVGLSIKSVNNTKAQEVGQTINRLNEQWIKVPTKANRNALDKAIQLYKYLVKR